MKSSDKYCTQKQLSSMMVGWMQTIQRHTLMFTNFALDNIRYKGILKVKQNMTGPLHMESELASKMEIGSDDDYEGDDGGSLTEWDIYLNASVLVYMRCMDVRISGTMMNEEFTFITSSVVPNGSQKQWPI